MRRPAVLAVPATLVLALALAACGKSSSAAGPSQIVMTFPALDAGAGQEVLGTCLSFTLNNDKELWVNAVEMQAGPGWHHSNWFFVPDTMYAGPDGAWDCSSRGFDEFNAGGAAQGGVLFAQSTQSTGETQQFPAGAAMKIPPHSRVVGGIHLVNASTSAIHTAITLTLDTIPVSTVTAKLRPMSMEYGDLSIPPNARSRFTGKCTVSGGVPMDFKIYYMLPHYHRYGTGMVMSADGPNGFTPVFENTAGIGEAWGKELDPPIDLNGQTEFDFSCSYDNTTGNTITWGNANGEMCVLLAYTDSPYRWVGGVLGGNAVVGTDANGVILNEGPCTFGAF